MLHFLNPFLFFRAGLSSRHLKAHCPLLKSVPVCVFVCQREGALADDDSADMDGDNGRGFEEYEWAGQKRIRATALLEGGFRGRNAHTYTLHAVLRWFDFPLTQGR